VTYCCAVIGSHWIFFESVIYLCKEVKITIFDQESSVDSSINILDA